MSSHPGSSHSISYAANAQASDISNPQGSTAPYQALPPGVHGFHGHGDDAASFHHHPSFLGAVVASGDPQYHAAAAAATTISHDSVFDIAVNQQPLDLEVVVPRYPLQGTDYIHSHPDSGGGFHPQTLTGVGQLPPHAGSQELPMRYQQAAAAADPPVSSSAEESNDGQRPKRVGASKPRDAGPESGSKKRSLDEAGGADEAAEGKKRARGRPRLNPKDQTATERRRTQIRLAQRAYRNRKENAITELEAQVRDLKEANSAMRSAVQQVFESSANNPHILAQAPELGIQLRRLQALVRRSRQVEVDADVEDDLDEDEDGVAARSERRRSALASNVEVEGHAALAAPRRGHLEQIYGDVLVPRDPAIHPQQHYGYTVGDVGGGGSGGNYQIIAAPTIENASFATPGSSSYIFTTTSTSSTGAGHTSSTSSSSTSTTAFSPWSTLPMPASGAYAETGFARRLHRFTTERAAYLICMRNPPPEKMMRVFGFARLFETTEQIRERTIAVLNRTRHQPLHNWNYPFHHLGGAGTHFRGGGAGDRGGGGAGDGSAETRGFRFGPMDATTSQIRDSLLTISQNIRMPGLQGLFWDCDEVEWYMRQNGVVIPDVAADFCPVGVLPAGCFQYQDVRHHDERETHPREANVPDGEPAASTQSGGAGGLGEESATPWQYGPAAPGMAMQPQHGFPAPHVSMPENAYQQHSSAVAATGPMGSGALTGKAVHLDITKFLNGLTSRAACLGRTPGFRPKDVDAAFWEAIIAVE